MTPPQANNSATLEALRECLPAGHPGKDAGESGMSTTQWSFAVRNLASNGYLTIGVTPQLPKVLFCSGSQQDVWKFVFDSSRPDKGIKLQHAATGMWVIQSDFGTLSASGASPDEAASFTMFWQTGGWGIASSDGGLTYGGDNGSIPEWLVLGLPVQSGTPYYTWVSEFPS